MAEGERALVPLPARGAGRRPADLVGRATRLALGAAGLALSVLEAVLERPGPAGGAGDVVHAGAPAAAPAWPPRLVVWRGLDLDGWAARGLAGQRRNRRAAAEAAPALVAAVTPVLPVWLNAVAGSAVAVGYLTACLASTGRTVGKQVAGLRVLGRSGRRLGLGRALLRAVLYTIFPAGLLWVLVSHRNASLQDLPVGSAVIYDWSYLPTDESPPSGDARSPSQPPASEHP